MNSSVFLLLALLFFMLSTCSKKESFTGFNNVTDVAKTDKDVYYGNLNLKSKVIDNFNSYVFGI